MFTLYYAAHSCSLAEFIIGPRYARTRWLAPGNDS